MSSRSERKPRREDYVTQGYGHIQSMPAFDPDTLAQATAKV